MLLKEFITRHLLFRFLWTASSTRCTVASFLIVRWRPKTHLRLPNTEAVNSDFPIKLIAKFLKGTSRILKICVVKLNLCKPTKTRTNRFTKSRHYNLQCSFRETPSLWLIHAQLLYHNSIGKKTCRCCISTPYSPSHNLRTTPFNWPRTYQEHRNKAHTNRSNMFQSIIAFCTADDTTGFTGRHFKAITCNKCGRNITNVLIKFQVFLIIWKRLMQRPFWPFANYQH
jgi:hypothetical protein